jgi:probable HAF family extracellular repeat protein
MKLTHGGNCRAFLAGVAVASGAASPAWAGPPSFQTLGFLDDEGFGPSIAYGVSDDGRVAVGVSNGPNGFEAFRWTAEAGMVGLGDLPGGFFSSEAFGCSADGSIVCGSSDDGSAGEGGTPFRWTQESGLVWLGSLGGPTTYGQGQAASDDGSVIVGASQTQGGIETYRWTEADGMVSIGDLPGGITLARATGISGDGARIVGYGSTDNGGFNKAFLWTENAGMVEIGDGRNAALGISRDGSTIVGIDDGRAFRWTEGEGMVNLPPFQDEPFNYYADAVSGDGSVIVGLANLNQGQGTGEAFIWDAEHGMRHLQTVLRDELGLNLDGFFLFDARGISADGRVIVGYGFNKFGEQEAFIADLGSRCYADCDTSTGPGTLDLFDFLCYVNGFNAGAGYADCDGDGALSLFDFLCFTNLFNAGC